MSDAIRHRGPDACGLFVEDGIALGHRRLSIIDLSETGAQPMRHAAATVSYNGEIYNFRELRAELSAANRAFRGSSDTEVMLQAYDQWGVDGLRRLEGIFAFALWDAPKRRLVLMRDRLGVKPLFYAWSNGRLLFASEIGAILAAGGVDRAIDQQALSEYLWYGNAFDDRTIYRAIKVLPPGHRMVVESGSPRIEPWFRIEEWLSPAPRPATFDDAKRDVRRALAESVRRQLVSDVPVGIFLSGGLDSSAIAYSAVHDGGLAPRSFTAGFDFEGGVNELARARRVAKFLGLDHQELRVSSADLREVLIALARSHGEPFADAANIPLYLMSRALAGQVTVVLQGDGGDEMFAGYRRSLMLRRTSAWRAWPGWLSAAVRELPGHQGRRMARMADAMRAPSGMRMALLLTVDTLADPPTSFLLPDTRHGLETETDPFRAFRECDERFAAEEPVQRMLLTDLVLQLPSQFLAKVDRATMAVGIEARVPLLDERVGALAVGLPSSWKVGKGRGKQVFREALRGPLPDDVLDGPKTGFGVPYQHWLRAGLHELARETILDSRISDELGFDRERLERALTEHRAGTRDHGFVLWKYFQLALWSEVMR